MWQTPCEPLIGMVDPDELEELRAKAERLARLEAFVGPWLSVFEAQLRRETSCMSA